MWQLVRAGTDGQWRRRVGQGWYNLEPSFGAAVPVEALALRLLSGGSGHIR
jgi:hypothetical protein